MPVPVQGEAIPTLWKYGVSQSPWSVNVHRAAGFDADSKPSESCQMPADAGPAGTRTAASGDGRRHQRAWEC